MALTLRLSGGGLSGPSHTKMLSKGTLSIGRGAGNDWVLPDPDRHLSKTHCVLSVENNRYFLTDLSTNGVHINGARQATARDSRTELTDGDDFRIGEYTITATETADSRSGGSSMLDPFATGPAEGGDPLDIDPLEDPLGRAPDPSFKHPIATPQIGHRALDPFDMDEERKHRKIDPDDDLFSGVKPSTTWQGPSQADNADASRHSFTAARVIQPVDTGMIDFDALIGDIPGIGPAASPSTPGPASAAPPSPRPRAAAPAPAALADPFADMDGLLEQTPAPTMIPEVMHPPAPAAPPAASVPPPAPRSRPPEPADPFAELDRQPAAPEVPAPRPPAPAPAAAAAPAAAVQAASPAAPAPASGADAKAVLQAFLEGAGVPQLPTGMDDPAETMRAVGQVFRAMTEGLREVLMSRAAIKSDLRVEATMIQARNNNALKFSVTVDDAVAALLNANRPGYMKPLAATKEAFNDLKSHELAVMSGVQTSLMGLLKRFDPATLESRMAQGLLGAVLPAARKARYWDSFQQVYGDIAKEAEDDFQAVFGRAFARAYTAQSRKGEPEPE